jgi:hypothetical protein
VALAYLRPGFPFRDRASFARSLAKLVRDAPPLLYRGSIAYCDDGAQLVGLPEEVAKLRCASCVLLSVYEATRAHQQGRRVDLCISVLGGQTEHAWIREDGRRRDPSRDGGLDVPSDT